MSFTVCTAEQRSPEWFAARVGLATGSRANDIVAKIKSGEAAARRDYRAQLVAERLTGLPQDDTFTNADMQRGVELEPLARMAYEAATGTLVEETGFLRSTVFEAGCSLDGSIEGGIIEIKCPRTATHLGYLKDGGIPSRYVPQICHNLLITQAGFCDFISYCPALPDHLSLFIVRAFATDLDVKAYEEELVQFLSEVADETETLKNWRKQ